MGFAGILGQAGEGAGRSYPPGLAGFQALWGESA